MNLIHPLLGALATLSAASCTAPITRGSEPVNEAPASAQEVSWQTIGESRQGRPVRAATLGRGGARVALITGIHGDEQEGLRHLDDVIELVARSPRSVRLIADANPDGTAAHTRGTSTGVDPNRNWPASNFKVSRRNGPAPLSEPAIAAVHGELVAFAPELVIVLHSARSGPFVNYDGPAEREAETFRRGAGGPWTVQPSMGYPTPGSLGTWMGIDRGVPILTIEFARGASAADSLPALLGGLSAVLGLAPAPSSTDSESTGFVVR